MSYILRSLRFYILSSLLKKQNFKTKNKKTKISEGNLERKNMKSLSNSVTKFYDEEISETFHFFYH